MVGYMNIEAWETELFDRYNGESRSQEEIEADYWDELEPEED